MVNFFLFISLNLNYIGKSRHKMKLPSLASGDKVGVKSVDKETVMAKWQLETRRDTIFESERSGIQDLEPSISWRNWLKETKTSGSREIVKTCYIKYSK